MSYPTTPGYKSAGPSREAAGAETSRSQALRVSELTADECAQAVGASVLAVRPRLSELREMHCIEDTGQRRKNASGHRAVVWRWAPRRGQLEMFT